MYDQINLVRGSVPQQVGNEYSVMNATGSSSIGGVSLDGGYGRGDLPTTSGGEGVVGSEGGEYSVVSVGEVAVKSSYGVGDLQ